MRFTFSHALRRLRRKKMDVVKHVIDIFLHERDKPNSDSNKEVLDAIAELRSIVMGMKEDFDAVLASIDAETTRIADFIAALLEQQNRTDLTAVQEAELKTAMDAALLRLKSVGNPATPVPPGELPPVPV